MDLDALKADLEKDFLEIDSQDKLNSLKVKYLGKKGHISELSKNIKNLSKKDRPKFGKSIGELRKLCEEKISAAFAVMLAISLSSILSVIFPSLPDKMLKESSTLLTLCKARPFTPAS